MSANYRMLALDTLRSASDLACNSRADFEPISLAVAGLGFAVLSLAETDQKIAGPPLSAPVEVDLVAAAELVRQYETRTGPLPGDPFDADLWMAEAVALLKGGA